MEINNQPIQGPRPNRRSINEPSIDITRRNRESIEQVAQDFEDAQYSTDRIELSSEGQALAAGQVKADEAKTKDAHQEKVQELKRQYLDGKLNTPERVEKAAHKMLTTD